MGTFSKEARLKSAQKNRESARARYYENPNYCRNCNKIIDVRDGERPADARHRKFCDRSCAATFNNKRTKKKSPVLCKHCGNQIPRQNKYCSIDCKREHDYAFYISEWLKGNRSGNQKCGSRAVGVRISCHIHRWIRENRGEKCERCGWDICHPLTGAPPLQIHHKNGNGSETTPDNIELLCPNCHCLTKNWGGLNK